MHACMYVCMYVCMHAYIHTYIHTYIVTLPLTKTPRREDNAADVVKSAALIPVSDK